MQSSSGFEGSNLEIQGLHMDIPSMFSDTNVDPIFWDLNAMLEAHVPPTTSPQRYPPAIDLLMCENVLTTLDVGLR
jgi:uncharacterized protein YejL (UPF0352 family)